MGSESAVNIHSRERLAWAFVLTGFIIFFGLLVSVPVIINAYIQGATRSLGIVLQAYQGTVSLNDDQGVQRAVLPGDRPQAFQAQSSIRTGFPATGIVFVNSPNDGRQLARLQIFANAMLLVEQADSPRFDSSDDPHELRLRLTSGRLHFKVLPDERRPFLITLTTPHGTIDIAEAGEYAIQVAPEESQIVVQMGQVRLTAQGQTIILLPNQRAEFYANKPLLGPLVPKENLIANGNFRQPLLSPEAGWQKSAWNIERPDQPKGQVRQIQTTEQSSLHLTRNGVGHADIHFDQPLDIAVPVNESEATLWLQIKFRIISQSLEVCGFQGSECPLFIQLAYEDENGNPQSWQQGFYMLAGSSDLSPYLCFSCAGVRSGHEQVVANEVTIYEIDMEEIGRLGPLPHHLTQLSLVASGHSFDVEILDVALFATATN
jgi:hypothetical protein